MDYSFKCSKCGAFHTVDYIQGNRLEVTDEQWKRRKAQLDAELCDRCFEEKEMGIKIEPAFPSN
jgi:hypothetical protein